jgi:reprolysin-like metallo-peptidase family M12B
MSGAKADSLSGVFERAARCCVVAILGGVCALPLAAPPAAQAIPLRGFVPLSVVLCKTSDVPADPVPIIGGSAVGTQAFYQQFFTNPGVRGMARYFQDQSYGKVSLVRGVVKGWYTMAQTAQQERDLGVNTTATRREDKIQHCLNAAAASPVDAYRPPGNAYVYAIANSGIDLFGYYRGSFADNLSSFPQIAHELAHNLGLNHSAADTPMGTITYGDWFDLMSCLNCAFTDGVAFGQGPSMIVAPNRDRMGWIPQRLIATFGADGATRARFQLSPINSIRTASPVLLRVPFDANNKFHYYTVELDQRDASWGAGLGSSVVLVHEIKLDGTISLVAQRDLATPGPVFVRNGVLISLRASTANSATVSVIGNIARQCRPGWVWREAKPSDRICVKPATRDQAKTHNMLSPGRTLPDGTCKSGYYWREAFPGDHACVPPPTRREAAADNAAHKDRVNPARDVFGPNTCSSGYVWREIDDSDYVCVTPAKRTEAFSQRAMSRFRDRPDGTCIPGFVWREAVLGDHACVTPKKRTEARLDNEAAGSHMVRPNG